MVEIHRLLPSTKIIVLTVDEDPATAAEALSRGALGYVSKRDIQEELFACIKSVQRGNRYVSHSVGSVIRLESELTCMERHLLQLLSKEREISKIADNLGIPEHKVRSQLNRLKAKLHVDCIEDLARHFILL
jgi:two-component system response regulator NreC